jgi:hypothetical protein
MLMAKDSFSIPLRAVIYREDKWWIAHCLELDLVAEGSTPAKAYRDLVEISLRQIREAMDRGDLESVFRPAPRHVWVMYGKSHPLELEPRPRLTKPVDRFEAREFQLSGS